MSNQSSTNTSEFEDNTSPLNQDIDSASSNVPNSPENGVRFRSVKKSNGQSAQDESVC